MKGIGWNVSRETLLALLFAGSLGAQTMNCDLTQRAYDNPFADNHGYWQPRYAWHAEKAVAGLSASFLLRKLHIPRVVARIVPALFVTALHVRGVMRHAYPFNPLDWIADAWMVSAGAVRPTRWVLGYIATGVCFASP